MDSSLRDDYASFLQELRQRDWDTVPVETRWIGYLYHIANLDNAVSILEHGVLYSRYEAQRRRLVLHDSAAAEVISTTDPEIQHCARLYFRPRTPTFYYNEGFRTKRELMECRFGGVHCPVPVALIFDAPTVMAMKGTRFSEINLATPNARIHETLNAFQKLPFEKIYHEGSVNDRSVIAHRQAEVIVPNVLGLNGTLRAVRCRTDAERATLLRTLSLRERIRRRQHIRTVADVPLFQADRLFIEKVGIVGDEVVIDLHLPRYSFTFDARFTADFGPTGRPDIDRSRELKTGTSSRLIVPLRAGDTAATHVEVTLRLDGLLAYQAILPLRDDVPF